MARRPLVAALVVGASALVLTGCIPTPPPLPAAPTTAPIDPSTTPAPSESSEPGASADPTEPSDGAFDYTVDDGAGDVWSFTVTGLEEDPPMESGEAEAGTYFVGILLDAEHVSGSASFQRCFDILVVGSDGVEYDWRDTIAVTAEDDVYYADTEAFTQARAVVQLPEDVDPDQVVLRTRFGAGEEIVLDVE